MTTNLTYNHLLEWDRYDLIVQILDLQYELAEADYTTKILQNEIKELTKK